MRSLRTRLVLWLMPPLVGVGLVAALAGYVFMTRQLTEAYDRDLGDIARAVVPYIELRDGRIALAFGYAVHCKDGADAPSLLARARDPRIHMV